MTVELIKSDASDADIVWAARVSTQGSRSLDSIDADPERSTGLIRYLIKNRHASPLEHSSFTFYIETPLFVVREIQRHRIASYNEWSGRYSEMDPIFYVPSQVRRLVQIGKTGNYEFEAGSEEQYIDLVNAFHDNSIEAFSRYTSILNSGVAREVARMVLPLNVYSSLYMTVNARALMNFLSLRTENTAASIISHPQREIEMVAEKMEDIFKEKMPITWKAWNDFGRISP